MVDKRALDYNVCDPVSNDKRSMGDAVCASPMDLAFLLSNFLAFAVLLLLDFACCCSCPLACLRLRALACACLRLIALACACVRLLVPASFCFLYVACLRLLPCSGLLAIACVRARLLAPLLACLPLCFCLLLFACFGLHLIFK